MAATIPKIFLKTQPATSPHDMERTRVWVELEDGTSVDLSLLVSRVEYTHQAGEIAQVRLHLLPLDMIDGQLEVTGDLVVVDVRPCGGAAEQPVLVSLNLPNLTARALRVAQGAAITARAQETPEA